MAEDEPDRAGERNSGPALEAVTDLHLREFVEADDAEVTSWFADAGELRFFAGPRLRWPLDTGQWRSIRMDPSVTAWTAVAGEDSTPIGHAEMVAQSEQTVRIARVAVAPTVRGQGVGRAVLSQLLEKCRIAGFSLVLLAVHPDNTGAIRAYRSLGFGPCAAPPPGSPAPSADRILLERRFPAAT